MTKFFDCDNFQKLLKFLALIISLSYYTIFCNSANAYSKCVSGKVYIAGESCTLEQDGVCTLWKAQWWINVLPGSDPAWKNMGPCDGKAPPPIPPSNTYNSCVAGTVYTASSALCSVTKNGNCTLWKAQWWVNTLPGTDSAWKNMGPCDGKTPIPTPDPTPAPDPAPIVDPTPTTGGHEQCVTGKVYVAGTLCTVGQGTSCTLWKAQWWVNSAPGTDPAWKNMGSCDGKTPAPEPQPIPTPTPAPAPGPTPAPSNGGIVAMNKLLDETIQKTPLLPDTRSTGIASWFTELKDRMSTDEYNSLLDVAYYVRTLPMNLVSAIKPGNPNNPENVKRVERIISETTWYDFFPMTSPLKKEGSPEGLGIYTYDNFLKAVGAFPAFCGDYIHHPRLRNVDADEVCKKLLATSFSHFNKETSANASNWNTPVDRQGLYWVREVGCKNGSCGGYTMGGELYPANLQQGNTYFGRGCVQLSHPVNYATYSILLFGKPDILLHTPDLVADTWLALGSGIYFIVAPSTSKPAIIEVVDGNYRPNAVDLAANFIPGFGLTTHIVNGGYECMQDASNMSRDYKGRYFWQVRADYYKYFAQTLGLKEKIDPSTLDCSKMKSLFTTSSSASRPYYFDSSCGLVRWQSSIPLFGGKQALATCQGKK